MIIRSVHVQNFRSILDETLECEPLTILVGPNGSGKSCFLRALDVFYRVDGSCSSDDFYNNRTEDPIRIEVTFSDLSESEIRQFGRYIQDDRLVVEKEISLAAGKDSQRYYGKARRHPDFQQIRLATGAAEQIRLYKELAATDAYSEHLPRVRSAADAAKALESYEEEHSDQCELLREPTQFFGDRRAGGGSLDNFTLYLLVPAVRDAEDDAAEGRGSILSQLLDFVVRSTLRQSEHLKGLQEDTAREYHRILNDESLPLLRRFENDLGGHLSTYAPGTAVQVSWQESKVDIPMPKADVRLIEDGYAATVGRTGHGLQRAFILSLLQMLAFAQRDTQGTERVDGAEDGADTDEPAQLPSLILAIEEPELFQHPNRQRHLAQVLVQLAEGGVPGVANQVQVLHSTHSPLLLDIDRVSSIRRLQKVAAEDGDPRKTRVFSATLDEVASDLSAAMGASGSDFSGTGLEGRLRGIMRPFVNEGFFADLAVLVEGDDDRAAVLGSALATTAGLEAAGISVIPCGGKDALCTVAAIFRRFEIPTFLIWDSDWDSDDPDPAQIDKNHHLLRLCSAELEEWPDAVTAGFACFRTDLETTVKAEIGSDHFEELLKACQSEFSIRKRKHALKNPSVWERLIALACEQGVQPATLECIVRAVVEKRSA